VIAVLETIGATVAAFGTLVLWGLMSAVNLVLAGVGAAATAVFLLLPSMPSVGTFHPTWLAEANWFYPFGAVVAVFVSGLTLYVGFLVVRYVLQLVRAA